MVGVEKEGSQESFMVVMNAHCLYRVDKTFIVE